MRLTARRLNRATLARQLLLRREPVKVTEAVRRVVALQAQEAASPYLALRNRLAPFDPAGLDAAFAGHEVIKATLMRITLHAVTAADYQRGVRGAAERAARGGPAEGVVGAAHVRAGGARRDRRAVVLRLPAVLPRR
ncbi:MAG TPA: crosslink repair DNA glycosylase YcaQ family protein, partial [Streptosporangiaceae bacterium]|nr:crosslink repair DNA glycosylase YcaQ family protein [Streptosporangiaceae bacterium]